MLFYSASIQFSQNINTHGTVVFLVMQEIKNLPNKFKNYETQST